MNAYKNHSIEEKSPSLPPRAPRTSKVKRSKEKKKPVVKLLIVLAVCIALFILTFGILYNLMTVSGEKELYYTTDFSDGADGWQGDDMQWQESFQGKDGLLTLTKKEFMAPHSMSVVPANEMAKDSFTLHYAFNMSDFTGEATTLSTLVFSTTSLSIVINDEGKIGISRDLFAEPIYSDYMLTEVKTDQWEDIYVYVDGKNDNLQIYQNGQRVLNETWEDPVYPLQEVWLGSIWLEGAGNYGAPKQLAFDQVEFGNEAILPKPTFLGFITTFILDFITSIGNATVKIIP